VTVHFYRTIEQPRPLAGFKAGKEERNKRMQGKGTADQPLLLLSFSSEKGETKKKRKKGEGKEETAFCNISPLRRLGQKEGEKKKKPKENDVTHY